MMNKLVTEDIGDYLEPKSKEEILKDIEDLEPSRMMRNQLLGITMPLIRGNNVIILRHLINKGMPVISDMVEYALLYKRYEVLDLFYEHLDIEEIDILDIFNLLMQSHDYKLFKHFLTNTDFDISLYKELFLEKLKKHMRHDVTSESQYKELEKIYNEIQAA